jgi:ABC-2 type transport system ATP-binding protein
MNSVEEICEEVAIINHSKKILQGSINEIKKNYEENLWTILYSGNQMNFTNAVWGGW